MYTLENVNTSTYTMKQPKRPRSVKISDTLWEKAKKKAGLIPVSAVIRELLDKWIRGEIDLESEEKKGKG